MRTLMWLGMSAAVFSLSGRDAAAQQGYYNRTAVTRATAARERDTGEELMPYRSRSTGVSAHGEYRRARPEPPPRPEAPPRPQPLARDYFPGLRAGYGPNRNTVNPAHLCVPGRRAYIAGR